MLTNQNFKRYFLGNTRRENFKSSRHKEVKLDRETGLFLFEDMTHGRRFEDKCAEMYYRGKMFGFVHCITARSYKHRGNRGNEKKT